MNDNTTVHEKQIDLTAIFKSVINSRKKVFRWAIAGLIIGIVIALSIPKQYTSTIKIAPEGESKNLGATAGALASMMGVASSTSSDGINEKVYPEIIKSTPFLLEFAPIEVDFDGRKMPLSDYILEYTKRPWWSYVIGFPSQAIGWIKSIGSTESEMQSIANSPAIQYGFAGMLGNGLKVETDSKIGIITITSTFQDSKITKTISDSLIVKLQRYMSNYRTAKTRNTLESTTQLLDEAKSRYYVADEEYARALDRNQNLISKRAEVAIERLQNERDLAYQVYLQLAQQVESLNIKLQEEIPVATIIEPATTPISPSAPSVMLIIVLWTFLCAFISAISIVIKTLLKQ